VSVEFQYHPPNLYQPNPRASPGGKHHGGTEFPVRKSREGNGGHPESQPFELVVGITRTYITQNGQNQKSGRVILTK
jgi:hypothetical protein